MFRVPEEVSFEDLVLLLIKEWFPEGGTKNADFEKVLADLIRDPERDQKPPPEDSKNTGRGEDKAPPFQLPVRLPAFEVLERADLQDSEGSEPVNGQMLRDPEFIHTPTTLPAGTGDRQKLRDPEFIPERKKDSNFTGTPYERVRVDLPKVEEGVTLHTEDVPPAPGGRTTGMTEKVPTAEPSSPRPHEDPGDIPERHTHRIDTERPRQPYTPQPDRIRTHVPEAERRTEAPVLKGKTAVPEALTVEGKPEEHVRLKPPVGETARGHSPERQPDNPVRDARTHNPEDPSHDVRQGPVAPERVYKVYRPVGESSKPDINPVKKDITEKEFLTHTEGPPGLTSPVPEETGETEVQVKTARPGPLLKHTQEVRQVNLRIEEASLKFRMQGNSLTVEVRTPQEIQNQVTFMESYRLVRN
ncbi:MAG: hypothetical protein Q9N26_00810, partial [Aquificota bacterium]|nr:hypothetical protein [Aquificota bacterium]